MKFSFDFGLIMIKSALMEILVGTNSIDKGLFLRVLKCYKQKEFAKD